MDIIRQALTACRISADGPHEHQCGLSTWPDTWEQYRHDGLPLPIVEGTSSVAPKGYAEIPTIRPTSQILRPVTFVEIHLPQKEPHSPLINEKGT